MTLRVLLIESEAEDVLFLRDVLTEIEDDSHWSTWIHIETIHARDCGEAIGLLAGHPIDIILLAHEIDAFPQLHAVAPQIPAILLVDEEDESLALRMMREGAQDYLLKPQLDCAPLAHAIHNAIDRHKLLVATRAGTIVDSLTGLPNHGGFLTLADRDRKLAERLHHRLMILVAEPDHITEIGDSQRRDLLMVDAADHLRAVSRPTDLLARIGPARFALSIFDAEVESVEEAWARIYSASAGFRIRLGAAIFDGDHPASLDSLLAQAQADLAPSALAMRR